jgi:hypothetical protein
MEATCHNLDQHNPDPEPNSILEFMGLEIDRLADSPVKHRLVALHRAAIESNRIERDLTRAVSGDVDGAIRSLRGLTATGCVVRPPNVHELRKVLARPLAILADPAGRTATQLEAARKQVDRLIFQTPRAQLLSAAVIHNLGKKKAAVLIERAGA